MRAVIVIEICDWCSHQTERGGNQIGWTHVEAPNGEGFDFCSTRCLAEADADVTPGSEYRTAMCDHELEHDGPSEGLCTICDSVPSEPEITRMKDAAFIAPEAFVAMAAFVRLAKDREDKA